MSKDPKYLETSKLMIYAEILTKMSADVYNLGTAIFKNHSWGGISTVKKDKLLAVLNKDMDIIEKKRIPIAKEISKRIKKDTGVHKGPWEIDLQEEKILGDNPILRKGEAEVKMDVMKKKNPTPSPADEPETQKK